ncbi:porin, partial [Microvirga massiliensis]|uniref:porin n=1 Tax=Microvirga massiliensis TaxID=1033741 RepID=UPI00062B4790
MTPLRGLFLGCAVAVTSGAQAADLPVKGAEPVDYVRVCPAYGTGFFYVPGTDSCLRIGGRVRADYLYQEPFTRAEDAIGFRARGRLNVDYRTMTEYGVLRTYIRYEIDRNTGVFASDGQVGTNPKVRQAFVQFGGLTAGRALSFFSDPDLPVPNFGDLRFDDPSNADVNLF